MIRTRLASLLLAAIVASPLSAQTTVYSTFGAGDSYATDIGWTISDATSPVGSSFSFAARFQYTPLTAQSLHSLRVAAFKVAGGDVFVDFLKGSSIASASLLESWTISEGTSGSQIFTLNSAANPLLGTGEYFWVSMRAGVGSWWAWNQNNQGILGTTASSTDAGASWKTAGPDASEPVTAPAFDVRVGDVGSVVPEPSTYALMAAGLVALGIVHRRRRTV